jgi:hypothetical protein
MSNPAPLEAPRRCALSDLFESGFIELLRLAPRNPLVRALVLRRTGQALPPECDTFESLQDWLEQHCDRRSLLRASQSHSAHRTGGIVINVEFSETEYGRADYTVNRSGHETFRVEAETLVEIVQDAIASGGGLDEVVELVAGKIDDEAWQQCEPSLNDSGDYTYDDHESTGSEDSETDYSKEEIRNAVLAFVRERHPELAAEL